MARTYRRAAPVGHRGRRQLGRPEMVRRETLLRLVGNQELQDARPRFVISLPDVCAVQSLRWRAAETGCPALENRRPDDSRNCVDANGRLPPLFLGPETARAARRSG